MTIRTARLNCATSSEPHEGPAPQNAGARQSDEIQAEIDHLRRGACTPAVVEKLRAIKTREDALALPTKLRLTWFSNLTLRHPELVRVLRSLGELLAPDNGFKIIPIIGMTSIGKSTLMGRALKEVLEDYCGPAPAHDLPFIVVEVPSHGDHRRSWAALYREVLVSSEEPLIESKRTIRTSEVNGQAVLAMQKTRGVDGLREFIRQLLVNRDVRAIVIDEAVHLKDYGDPESTMNALKSMADVHAATKLILLGSFDLLGLVTRLDQVVRRGGIVHFRRYLIRAVVSGQLTADERAFYEQLRKLESLWPWEKRPHLVKNWHKIALACWGSIGALKTLAMRLLILQSRSGGGVINAQMWNRASMPRRAIEMIEGGVAAGEEAIRGWEYGAGAFSDDELKELVSA